MKRHAFLALSGISTLLILSVLFALVLRDARPYGVLGVSEAYWFSETLETRTPMEDGRNSIGPADGGGTIGGRSAETVEIPPPTDIPRDAGGTGARDFGLTSIRPACPAPKA